MIKTRQDLINAYDFIPEINEYYRQKNPKWAQNREAMHVHVKQSDPDEFLRWSTVTATMFTIDAPYIDNEYKALMEDSTDRWMKAITETPFGNPHLYKSNGRTSGNLIHQAYHLMQLEKFTGQTVDKMNRIVEFGGGYGAMCLIAKRLGFEGAYHIFDLHEFSFLQEYYLNNVGAGKDVYYYQLDDYGRFPAPPVFTDCLIGCFSLSEVTYGLRDAFINATDADNVMIAMTDFWHSDKPFKEDYGVLKKSTKKYEWSYYKSESVKGGVDIKYLMGKHRE